MTRLSVPLLSSVGLAGLSLFVAMGCGDSGLESSGGAETGGCGRCDASTDDAAIGSTGGAGGRGGGGSTTSPADVASDADRPEEPGGTGGVPGTGGAGAVGSGGSIGIDAGGTGGSVDSGTGPACIELGDIPTAWIQTTDSSERIAAMWVLDGPCDASTSPNAAVTFLYWEKGYSCPRLSDRVTCKVEATSSAGATTVFTVEFTAVPLSAAMLHWQTQPSQITLTFPSLDGGVGGGGAGGVGGGGAGGGAGGTWSELWTTVAIVDGRLAANGNVTQPPNGYGWVSLAAATTLLSPLCSGVPITSSSPCVTVPDWSDSRGLCISGAIPAFNQATDDFSLNWGVMVGANVTEPSGGGLGTAYTRTFVTLSGTPATGLRLVVHRKGDPDSITYCVAVATLERIPFSSFNTRCWDGTGIYLQPEDVPNIDKIALYVPSTGSPVSIDNLCLTGLYLQ